jgi:hypothetical protein
MTEPVEKIVEVKTTEALGLWQIAQTKPATQEDYDSLTKVKLRVKAALKDLEDIRVSITGPLNESLKRINALFAAPKIKLAEAEGAIKINLREFEIKQENIRIEQQRLANEAAEKARQELLAKAEAERKKAESMKTEKAVERHEEKAVEAEKTAAAIAPAKIAPTFQASSANKVRKVWDFEITNFDLVPREVDGVRLLAVDETGLRRLITSTEDKSLLIIPGIRIFQKEVLI